jgi:hypothetical protein
VKTWVMAVLAVLMFIPAAHADTFTDSNGTIIYPDGSVITPVVFLLVHQPMGLTEPRRFSFSFREVRGTFST